MYGKLFCPVCLALAVGLAITGVANAGWPGLAAHWRLDEKSGTVAGDASGNAKNGTLYGGARWTAGKLEGGLYLDGIDDYLEVPNVIGQAGTLAFWFKPDWDGSDPQDYRLFDASLGGIYFFIGKGANHADINPEDFGFYLEDATDADYQGIEINPAGVIFANTWFHVAVTWQFGGGPAILYIDGREAARANTLGPLPALHANPRFGLQTISYIPSRNGAKGVIDDIVMFSKALMEQEIQVIMVGLGRFPYAWNPSPPDGALHKDTWISLGWSAGDFAVSHDVYLGDNLADVENATRDSGVFRGNQTSMFYVAGFPGFAYPDGLVPGTTYYWRIDEVNDLHPDSPWKGPIWSFSIPPRTAYNPSPADGAQFVNPDSVTLTWTAGFGAKLHHVYLGTNLADVEAGAPGAYKGPTGLARFVAGKLDSEKVYYWRVDEFDGTSTYKGSIWAFTTPGAVGNPQPANRAVGVQMIAKLSWTPATNAASHQVYFGTDKDAVRSAATSSPEYKGNRPLGSETYDPGKLVWHSTYYWRVDAVYNTGTVKGLVWTFTTADFLLVDDFESYNDIDPPDPASNRIFDKWIDGFGTTNNGALVGNDMPPYAERTIVHGGAQAMPYSYDNNLKTSEATLTLVYPRDWTEEGVGQLSLWFRGAPANAAERMYVALNGTSVVYHDDPAVTQTGGWTEWVIDLQAFQGVSLNNVNTITIGLGTKNSPAAGGSGKLYFDDIRLYQSR